MTTLSVYACFFHGTENISERTNTNSLYNTGRNEANYSKGPPTDWGTRRM